jgi:hypothetical protein
MFAAICRFQVRPEHRQAFTEAGMQYFIAFIYGNDIETARLLIENVAPELRITGAHA